MRPGWKIAERFWDVIRFCSDFDAKTANKSKIYNNNCRFNGGKSAMSFLYTFMASAGGKLRGALNLS